MIKELVKFANHLDSIGLRGEADLVDGIVSKYANSLTKISDEQHGMFQHFQSSVIDYDLREEYTTQRMGESTDRDSLYGVFPEQVEAHNVYEEPPRSLSTRYSPDRVGVQARRLGDGVYQDPYTNKTYDYNEGFKTEDGSEFVGGSVDNQTKLYPM
jgi:hypothetical protein